MRKISSQEKLHNTLISLEKEIDVQVNNKRNLDNCKKILIHLVFWHESFAFSVEKILNHEFVDLPKGSYKQNNSVAIQSNIAESIPKLIQRLRAAEERIERFSTIKKINKMRVQFKEGWKFWSYDQALLRIDQHLRRHMKELDSYNG